MSFPRNEWKRTGTNAEDRFLNHCTCVQGAWQFRRKTACVHRCTGESATSSTRFARRPRLVQPTYLHKHDAAPLCFPFSLRAPLPALHLLEKMRERGGGEGGGGGRQVAKKGRELRVGNPILRRSPPLGVFRCSVARGVKVGVEPFFQPVGRSKVDPESTTGIARDELLLPTKLLFRATLHFAKLQKFRSSLARLSSVRLSDRI